MHQLAPSMSEAVVLTARLGSSQTREPLGGRGDLRSRADEATSDDLNSRAGVAQLNS